MEDKIIKTIALLRKLVIYKAFICPYLDYKYIFTTAHSKYHSIKKKNDLSNIMLV